MCPSSFPFVVPGTKACCCVAAAIAVVALLAVVVLVAVAFAVVDLRRDGFENKKREGVGGRAQRLPPRRWEDLYRCSIPLPGRCFLVGFVVAGFVLVLVVGIVAANVLHAICSAVSGKNSVLPQHTGFVVNDSYGLQFT